VQRALHVLLAAGASLALAGSVDAATTPAPETVSVHVPHRPSIRQDVHISFRSGGQLPEHGYYYAVIVLRPYRHYTRAAPPPCSTSSNMERTDYGYPQPDGTVRLSLTPARSPTRHWCRGGSYLGAVYAVPQAPPCEGSYPCPSEPYVPPSPCWELETGRKVCGVVVLRRRYAYPDGPPQPLAKGSRIVGHFRVVFR